MITMKGLLMKDFYTVIKAKVWILIPVTVILGIAAVFSNINRSVVWIGLYLYPFYGALMTDTLIRTEKSSRWIIYVKSLPVKLVYTIISKYIVGSLIMLLISVVTGAVSFMIQGFSIHIVYFLIMLFSVYMIITAINMPIACGMKDRHANLLGTIIKFIIVSVFSNIAVDVVGVDPMQLYTAPDIMVFFIPALILFIISVPVSAWIYGRKEF